MGVNNNQMHTPKKTKGAKIRTCSLFQINWSIAWPGGDDEVER